MRHNSNTLIRMMVIALFSSLILAAFPERHLFCAWPDSINQVFEVMHGVVGVNGIPTEDGGIIIIGSQMLGQYVYRMQRIDRNGDLLWQPDDNGIRVSAADGNRFGCNSPRLLSDGQNGVYVFYILEDYINVEDPNMDPECSVYIQHIDHEGNRVWGDFGLAIDTSRGFYAETIDIVRFGDDQLALFWKAHDGEARHTYGQLLDGERNRLWDRDGRLVHNDPVKECFADEQNGFFLISGESWLGNRVATSQYIDANGEPQWGEEGIEMPMMRVKSSIQLYDSNIMFCGIQNARDMNYFLNIIDSEGNLQWEESRQLTNVRDPDRFAYLTFFDSSRVYMRLSEKSSGRREVYGQMLDTEGNELWNEDGIRLFPGYYSSSASQPVISNNFIFSRSQVTDDSVGNRQFSESIQKVDDAGRILFGERGLEPNPPFHNNYPGRLMLDGSGGLIYPAFRSRTLCLWRIRPDGSFGAGPENAADPEQLVDEMKFQLILYPNPTNSGVRIQMPDFYGSFQWQLFDMTGRLVLSSLSEPTINESNLNLEMDRFNTGVYLFRMTNRYGTQSKAIILIK
ncbi:MAG: T9SS type A sorting domain-containing protein [Candidatus Hatepunaea meridiana]|nr:T9SS type A sorting domain-containing protein [Candidatus Hatepunaea meridiana]